MGSDANQDGPSERRREQMRAANRRWRERHPEEARARDAARYAANPGYQAEWRAKNREKINAQQRARRAEKSPETLKAEQAARWENEWRRQVKSKYGITAEQYDAMLTAQHGKCALCGREGNVGGRRLAVDHCHGTGVVRGLLCNPCNTMLGNARDNVDLLTSAIAYILTHRDILGDALD